jgi:hypothetical protein
LLEHVKEILVVVVGVLKFLVGVLDAFFIVGVEVYFVATKYLGFELPIELRIIRKQVLIDFRDFDAEVTSTTTVVPQGCYTVRGGDEGCITVCGC